MKILAYYESKLQLVFCDNCVVKSTNLLGDRTVEIYNDCEFLPVSPIFDYTEDDYDSVFMFYELDNFEQSLECAECETKIATN